MPSIYVTTILYLSLVSKGLEYVTTILYLSLVSKGLMRLSQEIYSNVILHVWLWTQLKKCSIYCPSVRWHTLRNEGIFPASLSEGYPSIQDLRTKPNISVISKQWGQQQLFCNSKHQASR
jgi:hypothetical protein